MRRVILPILCLFGFLACGGVTQGDGDGDGDIDAGVVDPCETNTCECEVDGDCDGDFEVCDTTSTPGRICACAAAYTDDGAGCVFSGAPADSGFQADDVWSTTNPARAVLDPNAAGNLDTGVATLTPDGVCVLDEIFQTFTMPPRDRSEVFAVDVNYFTEIGGMMGFDSLGPALLINGGWNTLPQQQGGFVNTTFCLGERGYGGDVEFRLGAANESLSCDTTPATALRFDRFAVRPAAVDECPTNVGDTINGDMEADTGWVFASASGGTVGFVNGIGSNGTRGLRITRTTTASRASATSRISLPLDATTPNAAIEFFTAGTASAVFEVQLGTRPVTRLMPAGLRRVCVPDWAKGTVQDITFGLTTVMTSGAPINRAETVDIDAIAIVSDAGCVANVNDYDNDFEIFYNTPGLTPGWAVTVGGVNGTEAPATILNDPNAARSGNGVLRLTATNFCNTAVARREILVPDGVGAAGPAVKGFINIPNAPNGRGGLRFARMPFRFIEIDGTEGAGYQPVTLCIPAKFSGRRLTIEAYGTGGGGGCSNFASENTFVDDVTITTDPTCPN